MSKQSNKKQLNSRLEDLFSDLENPNQTKNAGGNVWTWEADSEGVFTACSPEVHALLGFNPEDLIGEKLSLFALTEDGKKELKNALRRKVFPTQAFPTYLTADGKEVMLELEISKKTNKKGDVTAWYGTAEPFTGNDQETADNKSLVLAEAQPLPDFLGENFDSLPAFRSESISEIKDLNLDLNSIEPIDLEPPHPNLPDPEPIHSQALEEEIEETEEVKQKQEIEQIAEEDSASVERDEPLEEESIHTDATRPLKADSVYSEITQPLEPEPIKPDEKDSTKPLTLEESPVVKISHDEKTQPLRDDQSALVDIGLIDESLAIEPEDETLRETQITDIIDKRALTPNISKNIAPDAKGLLEIIDGDHGRKWSQEELNLVEQVASQLSLAMENATLFQQTQEALSETDILYQASADLNAANNYVKIIASFHKHAIPHYEPILSAINLFSTPYTVDSTPEWVEVISRTTDLPTQKLKLRYKFSEVAHIVNLASPDKAIHITDIDKYSGITNEAKELITEMFGGKSAIFIPITIGGEWLGFLDFYFESATFFNTSEERRLDSIGIQTAEKINSVRVNEEDAIRRNIADQLNSIARVMSEMVSENELIELTAELIFNRISPDQLTLFSYRPDENALKVALRSLAVPDASEDNYQVGDIIPLSEREDLEHVVDLNEPVYTATDWAAGFLKEHYCIPWYIGDRVAGLFEFYHIARSASITEHDQNYIEGVILQASSSIERARLFEQTEEALKITDKQARRLRILNQMSDELTLATTEDQIYRISIINIADILEIDHASIGMFDVNTNQYRLVAVTGQTDGTQAGEVMETTGSLDQALQSKQIVQNPNHELEDGSVRSTLVAPLLIGGNSVGTINVGIDRQNAFDQADENIMQQIASLLSSVLENNRLFSQIQRRSLQLETSAEVSRTASTILDTVELLPEVVNLIKDGYDLYYVGLFMVDTNGQWTGEPNKWAVLQAGTGQAGLEMLKNGHKLEIGGTSMIGTSIQNREARIALDVGEEARFFRNPYLPDTRSEMALPLISRGRVLGALSIQSTQQSAFSNEDITALQTMADQVANTIENASLFEQTEERAEELAILNEMARAFTQSLEVDNIIESIYDYSSRLMDTSNFYLALYNTEEDNTEFKLVMEDGQRTHYDMPKEKTGKIGPTEWIIKNRQPLLVSENVMTEFENMGFEMRGRPAESWLGVPMLRGNDVIGVMAAQSFNAPRLYNAHHLDLLSAVANQASIAIDNAQRFQESQQKAHQEQILREITAKVHNSADPDTILRTAVREISNALGRQTYIQIGTGQLTNGTEVNGKLLPPEMPKESNGNGHAPSEEPTPSEVELLDQSDSSSEDM